MDIGLPFWLPVVGAVLAAIIIGLASPLGKRIRKQIYRGVLWLLSFRPTLAEERALATKHQVDIDRLSRRHTDAIAKLAQESSSENDQVIAGLRLENSRLTAEIERLARKLLDAEGSLERALENTEPNALQRRLFDLGFTAGRMEAREERLQLSKFIATEGLGFNAPDPRWLVNRSTSLNEFVLENVVTGSVALRVRLEVVDAGSFRILDAATWKDGSGERLMYFRGEVLHPEDTASVALRVNWFSPTPRARSAIVTLDLTRTDASSGSSTTAN